MSRVVCQIGKIVFGNAVAPNGSGFSYLYGECRGKREFESQSVNRFHSDRDRRLAVKRRVAEGKEQSALFVVEEESRKVDRVVAEQSNDCLKHIRIEHYVYRVKRLERCAASEFRFYNNGFDNCVQHLRKSGGCIVRCFVCGGSFAVTAQRAECVKEEVRRKFSFGSVNAAEIEEQIIVLEVNAYRLIRNLLIVGIHHRNFDTELASVEERFKREVVDELKQIVFALDYGINAEFFKIDISF
ncbi:unknown [Acidaminococcus sp. CAG:917]|nr:unknown [Acidaminococcus sp. CAG:917]